MAAFLARLFRPLRLLRYLFLEYLVELLEEELLATRGGNAISLKKLPHKRTNSAFLINQSSSSRRCNSVSS
jgi:hypothetical protein